MICSASVYGQEGRSLTGSAAMGWSNGRAKSTLDESRSNFFSMFRVDYDNYLLDPRFLTVHVQPRLSTGFEDFYLGQFQGSGVVLDSTFLPESSWPVRFYYERVRRFSLSSGLGTTDSRSRTKLADSRFGISGNLMAPGRPKLDYQFSKTAGGAEPESALFQGFDRKGRALSVHSSDFRKGWNLDGSLRMQKYNDLIAFRGDRAVLRDTDTDMNDFVISAQRKLRSNTTFLAQALRDSGEVQFEGSRATHAVSQIRGQLVHNNPNEKLWASLQGQIGSTSAQTRIEPSLTSDSNRPLATLLTSSAERNASSRLRYFVKPYLSVSGGGQVSQVSNPLFAKPGSGQEFSGSSNGGGSSVSGGPGIALNKGGRYWTLSAGYDLNLSRIRNGAEIARSVGHSMASGFAAGDPSIFRGGANYQQSRRRVEGGLLLGAKEELRGVVFDAEKRVFRWMRLQGRVGLHRREFNAWNFRSDNPSREYRASLRVPRLELTWSREINSGEVWQLFFLTAATAPGPATPARPPLTQLAASGVPLMAHGQRIPAAAAALSALSAQTAGSATTALGMTPLALFTGSSGSATSLTGSLTISRHASLRGTWQGQRQAVAAYLPSRFEQHNAVFEWRFRMMTAQAVYQMIRYDLGTPIFRKQVMFRITRDFAIY